MLERVRGNMLETVGSFDRFSIRVGREAGLCSGIFEGLLSSVTYRVSKSRVIAGGWVVSRVLELFGWVVVYETAWD